VERRWRRRWTRPVAGSKQAEGAEGRAGDDNSATWRRRDGPGWWPEGADLASPVDGQSAERPPFTEALGPDGQRGLLGATKRSIGGNS